MSQKTPLQVVTEKHGGKEKLVDKLVGLVDRDGEEDKDAVRARLLKVSNQKLIRLAKNAEQLKAHGSKEKLLDTVMSGLGRVKDTDYKTKLATWSSARLMDLARTIERRAKKLAAKPAKVVAKPAAKAAKPAAKAKTAAKPAAAKAGKAASKKPAKS